MKSEKQIPIWLFIGVLLTVYGVVIFGAGIHAWINPPPRTARVVLWNLHANVWWGALLIVIGLIYAIRFWPHRPVRK